MRCLFGFILLLLMTPDLQAQVTGPDTLPPSAAATRPPDTGNPARIRYGEGLDPVLPPGRMRTTISVGTQFSTSSWFGSGLTTYIAPSVSYRISPRFSVRGGIAIAHTTLFNYRPWYAMEQGQTYDANFTRAILYLEGSCRVTERLTISGAGFKEFTVTDNSTFYNPFTHDSPQGIYLNADYRIADGIHIQAGFGYTKGYSPFSSSPFHGASPLYDPSPFGTIHPRYGGPFQSAPLGW